MDGTMKKLVVLTLMLLATLSASADQKARM